MRGFASWTGLLYRSLSTAGLQTLPQAPGTRFPPWLVGVLCALLAIAGCAGPATRPGAAPVAERVLRPLPTGWQRGAFAEIYVRGYRDSDGDGIGDLRGLTQSLDYLAALGVRGLWLMPVTASQDHDHGYATSNYRDIEPDYGTLADFDELLRQAHARGIGVIMDYVINHSAAEHPLFQQALHDRNSAYRRWYVWSDAKPGGWSIWGHDPWTLTPTGAYFHVFSPTMPDFNFREPAVEAFHVANMRFWLDRGVDGFRFDAVTHLFEKDAQSWRDQPESLALMGRLRVVVDAYPNRFVVCEATHQQHEYASSSVCGNAFAMDLSQPLFHAARGDAKAIGTVADYFVDAPAGMASMLSNHDLFAGDRAWNQLDGNIAQYKLAAASYLLRPGTPFILYGEEIGMAAADITGDSRLRAPMSWTADPRTAGFTTGTPFRALPTNVAAQNVAAELARPDGLLAWYRDLLRVRNTYPSLSVGRYLAPQVQGQVTAFQRSEGRERSLVLVNDGTVDAGIDVAALPPGGHFRQVFPRGATDGFDASADGRASRHLAAQSVRVYVAEARDGGD